MSLKREIRFNNGKLKVLQISDLQDTKITNVDTLRFIESAMENIKPDLIVFTGDQLDVVGMWGKGDKCKKNVTDAINSLFGIFEKFDVPYVLTFGNHDKETGISNEEQAEIYNKFNNCVCFNNLNDGRPDCGTFNVPIMSSDGKKTAMNFYLIDTHSKEKGIGYRPVEKKQLDWYEHTRDSLIAENGGKIVPSIVFQHIPVCEIYEMLSETDKGGLPAYGKRKGKRYILNDEYITSKGDYGETPATPDTNSGEFELMKSKGDVFAMFFGHDHYNSFVGKVQGIDMGYCPGAGYNTYGLKDRAVRVFEFDENDVTDYKTYTVNYSDVCNKSLTHPIQNFLYSNAPSSPEGAGPFTVKCVVLVALLVLIFNLLYYFVSKIFVTTFLIALGAAAVIYIIVSIVYTGILRKEIIKSYKKAGSGNE